MSLPAAPPDPDTTLAIIAGVSSCPRAPALEDLPQCAASAEAFSDYLCGLFKLPRENLLNVFDSDSSASDQLELVDEWLTERGKHIKSVEASGLRDLLFFYSGHGGLTRPENEYFLATRRTRAGREGGSSIRFGDLAAIFRSQYARRYIILDCCFAAQGVSAMQSSPGQLLLQGVEEAFPAQGTAFLCSSAARKVSIAPRGEKYTMFSGALLKCLSEGHKGARQFISLEELGERVRHTIEQSFPDERVRPELHVPDQVQGNPATVPLFPNTAWQASATSEALQPTPDKLASFEKGESFILFATTDDSIAFDGERNSPFAEAITHALKEGATQTDLLASAVVNQVRVKTKQAQVPAYKSNLSQPLDIATPLNNKIALIIGESEYKHVQPLMNPANDAIIIARALGHLDFETIIALDSNKDQMRKAIVRFISRLKSSNGPHLAVIYFAGHAMQVDGENYLIPVDAELRHGYNVHSETISLKSILEPMEDVNALKTLILFDACRDNPFIQQIMMVRQAELNGGKSQLNAR